MRLLVTGAAGFIGANFVRHVLAERPACSIVVLDALTYAGNLRNLDGCETSGRYRFVHGDICDDVAVESALSGGVDAVVNFAAESHVDRSIHGGAAFIRTNVTGTQVLLDAARRGGVQRFLQVSTDEVYGSLGPTGLFTESTALDPSSPYSASKAAADLVALSYFKTHKLPVLITRCSNNYGPYQFPEKMIPLFVTNLLEDQPVPLYGDGLNIRDWIHVSDHCAALLRVLEAGRPGEVYNIGGGNERTNLDLTHLLLDLLHKPTSLIRPVADRAAHDRRYAVDTNKIQRELGWYPRVAFEQGLRDTVAWYVANEPWWREIKSGDYRKYYQRQYAELGA